MKDKHFMTIYYKKIELDDPLIDLLNSFKQSDDFIVTLIDLPDGYTQASIDRRSDNFKFGDEIIVVETGEIGVVTKTMNKHFCCLFEDGLTRSYEYDACEGAVKKTGNNHSNLLKDLFDVLELHHM